MDFGLLIYIFILASSIDFGYFYRQIKNKNQKKWVGSAVGLLIIFMTTVDYIWHAIFLFLVNAGIILFLPKSHCHLISFLFSFLHLLFFRLSTMNFGISYLPVHTNMMQMMLTLKLVGLAFEVNSTYMLTKDNDARNEQQNLDNDSYITNMNFWEMFHYTFHYIGIATGPYYRYRTFVDFFNLPFSDNVSYSKATFKILAYVLFYFVVYLWGTYNWPLSYALSDEFYNDCSWVYRFWYAWPTFFNFRMQLYSGVQMSEAVCTMVGFGAYPSVTEPRPGQGPTKNYEKIGEIANSSDQLTNLKYDFKTINNMYPYEADFCTTSRVAMKNWNMCIQYWLVVNIYKRFPIKRFRTGATMLVSAFWHGLYLGYYICIGSVPFYLALEDVYVKLLLKNNSGMFLKISEWIIWFFKMQAFSYLSVAFHLLTFQEVVRYYRSTYCCGFVIGAILYIIGLQLLRIRKIKSENKNIPKIKIDSNN